MRPALVTMIEAEEEEEEEVLAVQEAEAVGVEDVSDNP
jgi:hypothetical protein